MSNAPSALTHDACWSSATALGRFSYYQLSARAGVKVKSVGKVVRDWERQGLVRRVGIEHKRIVFALVEAEARRPVQVQEVERSRRQTPYRNMWTAMRGLRVFTPVDLAANATTPETLVTVELARKYCRALVPSGHLKPVRTAVPGRREARYQLVRNTGPLPPRERRVQAVYDDNLGRFMHVDGVAP